MEDERRIDRFPWERLEEMDSEELHRCLDSVWERIRELDAQEPPDMDSEDYDQWADCHEELEDLADELRDRLDDLGED